MKNYFTLLFIFFVGFSMAQTSMPDEIDASYAAKFEIKGVGGRPPNPERKIRLALKNDQPILSVVLCEGCFPAEFSLIENLSDAFGELVFKNNLGIYMLVYNEKGFVIAEPSSEKGKKFSFLDLYTRRKAEYDAVTKVDIETYALKLLDIL